MKAKHRQIVKTSIILEKHLIEEIDEYNPFTTRKEFLDQACRGYLLELKRRLIDEKLADACSKAKLEDQSVDDEWEEITLESWK